MNELWVKVLTMVPHQGPTTKIHGNAYLKLIYFIDFAGYNVPYSRKFGGQFLQFGSLPSQPPKYLIFMHAYGDLLPNFQILTCQYIFRVAVWGAPLNLTPTSLTVCIISRN